MSVITSCEAQEFLFREAYFLDTSDFDAWIELYTLDAVYWAPAWADEETLTQDPDRELSLIYYHGRENLEDRIRRIRSGQSIASRVRPRVMHAISNVMLAKATSERAIIRSCFTAHVYDVRAERTHVFFGRYEHTLVRDGDGWKISRKLIHLLNDVIPTMLDVYSI